MNLWISKHFFTIYSKDVRLPIQLQRAMAAEAEASREARAKVIIKKSQLFVEFFFHCHAGIFYT